MVTAVLYNYAAIISPFKILNKKAPHSKYWRAKSTHEISGGGPDNYLGKILVAINLSSQIPRAMANVKAVNAK